MTLADSALIRIDRPSLLTHVQIDFGGI